MHLLVASGVHYAPLCAIANPPEIQLQSNHDRRRVTAASYAQRAADYLHGLQEGAAVAAPRDTD